MRCCAKCTGYKKQTAAIPVGIAAVCFMSKQFVHQILFSTVNSKSVDYLAVQFLLNSLFSVND